MAEQPAALSGHDYDLLYAALERALTRDGEVGMDIPRTVAALEAIDQLHGRKNLAMLLTGRSPRNSAAPTGEQGEN
jgi:hypothetical protein